MISHPFSLIVFAIEVVPFLAYMGAMYVTSFRAVSCKSSIIVRKIVTPQPATRNLGIASLSRSKRGEPRQDSRSDIILKPSFMNQFVLRQSSRSNF